MAMVAYQKGSTALNKEDLAPTRLAIPNISPESSLDGYAGLRASNSLGNSLAATIALPTSLAACGQSFPAT